MSVFVPAAQSKSARRIWSLSRAYQHLANSPSASSPSSVPQLSVLRKPSPVSVAYASSSVALSSCLLRRVAYESNHPLKSTLSTVFLQLRRTARRNKCLRNTERFVPIKNIMSRSSELD